MLCVEQLPFSRLPLLVFIGANRPCGGVEDTGVLGVFTASFINCEAVLLQTPYPLKTNMSFCDVRHNFQLRMFTVSDYVIPLTLIRHNSV